MKRNILSALKALHVAELDRAEWIAVGMVLKTEGYPVSVWDEWSRNDRRYHTGECERLWNGFHGSETPVTGGTIIQMAKDRGWDIRGADGCMGWEDEISYDGAETGNRVSEEGSWKRTEEPGRAGKSEKEAWEQTKDRGKDEGHGTG